MSITRQTALVTHERREFGGSYFDSFTHAKMFKSYQPFDMGVKTARLFSQELGNHQINKKFTHYTLAQKNAYVLPGGTDDYVWYVGNDSTSEFRITEFLGLSTDTPGKGGLPFKFAADKDWLHEPAVIKLGGHNLPLIRILGYPIQRSANSFEYEGVVQDGDVNAWIPVAELQPDKTFMRVSSIVSDELNKKFAPDEYGDMFKLQSWVSNYANKAEFTDKFIRTEIACRMKGEKSQGSYSIGGNSMKGNAVTSGYVYQTDIKDKTTGNMIQKGTFITAVEARLEERTMMDREMAMTFARLQKTTDRDSGRIIKVAPGWEQLRQDGHYLEHNGSLSLDQMFEFVNNIFINKRGFTDRKLKFSGGEAGIRWLSKLIYAEYASLLTVDTNIVSKNTTPSGFHGNELQFGAQFTKILLPNGVELSIDYDPTKDDRSLYKTLAPGTNSTLESYTLDIFDFGSTDQNATGANTSNITMVMQDGVEMYATVCGVYDFETGARKDGSNTYSLNKECGVYREMSGSLGVWDTERIGCIRLNPFM